MFLYITLYIYLAALSFLDYVRFSTVSKRIFIYAGTGCVFLIFWFLASFKWRTGTDWESYHDAFCYFSEDYSKLFEPGFGLFIAMIKKITNSYTVYLAIFSFFCLSFKFNFFLKYHKETIFTTLLLFLCYYFGDIFAVRQNLAMSLTLFSTRFIIDKKPIPFAIMVGLASTIHFTSVLYFLAYAIYWMKITDKTFYILMIISIIFGMIGVGGKILTLILQIIGVTGHVGEKISGYLNSSEGDDLNVSSGSLIIYVLGLIKRIIFIPVFILIKNKIKFAEPKIQGYINLYMFGNIVYFLFAKDLAVFARASVPFLLFEIFLVGYGLSYFRRSKVNLVFFFLIMMVISFGRFNALINSYYHLYVPYNSIFNDHANERILE